MLDHYKLPSTPKEDLEHFRHHGEAGRCIACKAGLAEWNRQRDEHYRKMREL